MEPLEVGQLGCIERLTPRRRSMLAGGRIALLVEVVHAVRNTVLTVVGACGLLFLSWSIEREGALSLEALLCGPHGRRLATFGSAWVGAMETIGAAIGPSEPYLVLDDETAAGEPNWIRFDLAPRLCAFLGRRHDGRPFEPSLPLPCPLPYWTVVARRWPTPPALVETFVILSEKPHILARWSDRSIVARIERAAFAADRGVVEIEGRCAARGLPCESFRVFGWGREMPFARRDRTASKGRCEGERAGTDGLATSFRLEVPVEPRMRGRVPIQLVVESGRRFRALPTMRVTVAR